MAGAGLAAGTLPEPSGSGCVECDEAGGWWFHLRRCVNCGHVGCCDDSLARHARRHFEATGHRYIQSFEPGEDWFWDYLDERAVHGPLLPPPRHHPTAQPAPGPEGRVPSDWRKQLASSR
ncbi:UBP-type zinc finger domain-containing protein [Sinomonas sp. ASV322]|uniref:UBP-type zinc finger domain-containing protein n=1 Tax=Sinomonas sp. ASV322 TaxID=3041920 RepID=UPI0027DB26B4|nr:UBP-type zinc finger domain-containing protein [Sinomonas sp. ASV322]MDQ4504494.1 UBP-type zinc finger domain-containing protein [Sinomonas sp. ASV322]